MKNLWSVNGNNSFQYCLCLSPASLILPPQLFCCNLVTACWFFRGTVCFQSVLPPPPPPPSHTHRYITHNWTAVPLYYPLSLCQSCESVDVDFTIKGKFHPQVLFPSKIPSICDAQCIPAVILWLSVAIYLFSVPTPSQPVCYSS